MKIDGMAIMACRYAHHRNTSATFAVVSEVIQNWENISDWAKSKMVEEAKGEATTCLEEWQILYDKFEEELKK